ncbi:methyltransferase family protein [Salinimonas chungwhensis]|uniref:methyltransferase family protein n=1 Tax=Salinimonas chungwhensis TaxID=265425 RepID=UPI00037682DD|nr:isoprenylcysteine carboxylmethyltransferase family protein [Salinimonas chungwhensis]
MKMALRIPPVIVLLIAGVLQQITDFYAEGEKHRAMTISAVLVFVIALFIGILAIVQFRHHQTTVDPRYPDSASSLITQGIFRVSRNPIYLAMALVLTAQSLWLSNWLTLIPLFVFCMYIQHFQIIPEEHALRAHFGSAYNLYCQRTRRWLGIKTTDDAR